MLMPMAKDDEDVAFEFTCSECGTVFYEKIEQSDFQDSEAGASRKCPECRKKDEEERQK